MKKTVATIATFCTTMSLAMAQNGAMQWQEALGSNDAISRWLRVVFIAIMAIFIMVSVILGSLAFKQLAGDGNWKDFWSKIAGAIGMFVVPIAIYWLVGRA